MYCNLQNYLVSVGLMQHIYKTLHNCTWELTILAPYVPKNHLLYIDHKIAACAAKKFLIALVWSKTEILISEDPHLRMQVLIYTPSIVGLLCFGNSLIPFIQASLFSTLDSQNHLCHLLSIGSNVVD